MQPTSKQQQHQNTTPEQNTTTAASDIGAETRTPAHTLHTSAHPPNSQTDHQPQGRGRLRQTVSRRRTFTHEHTQTLTFFRRPDSKTQVRPVRVPSAPCRRSESDSGWVPHRGQRRNPQNGTSGPNTHCKEANRPGTGCRTAETAHSGSRLRTDGGEIASFAHFCSPRCCHFEVRVPPWCRTTTFHQMTTFAHSPLLHLVS